MSRLARHLEELGRWRWLAAEFVVIVLGVLGALAVDTWMDDHEAASRAVDYRVRLTRDIEHDIVNLQEVISYYRNIRAHGLATLDVLEGDTELDDMSLMFSAFNAAEEWGFTLETATFDDMRSTGGLGLIADVQLRLDIAEYYRQGENRRGVWDLPRAYRERARGIIPDALQTAIHERCQLAGAPFGRSADVQASSNPGSFASANVAPTVTRSVEPLTGSADATDLCGLDATDFALDRAAHELRADTEIRRLLRFRMSEVRVAIALYEGQEDLAEALLVRLRQD